MKIKVAQSCLTLCDPMYYTVHGIFQNTGVGSLFPSQGIFPTQGFNPGLPHCRRIFFQLSHKGSPRIPKWVAYPFSSRSSPPRNRTRVSSLQVDSLPAEPHGMPKNTGVDSLSLLQGIFPTQESNQGLLYADSVPFRPQ